MKRSFFRLTPLLALSLAYALGVSAEEQIPTVVIQAQGSEPTVVISAQPASDTNTLPLVVGGMLALGGLLLLGFKKSRFLHLR